MEIRELSNHIVICGWNRMAVLLIDEFAHDPRLSKLPVVVVAEFGEMDVFSKVGQWRDRVFPLDGDPTRIDVLEQAGTERAAYAILLADKLRAREDQDRDARTILTAMTIEKMNPKIYTVAELLSREGINHLKLAGIEEVIISDQISSNLISTCLRNRGMLPMVEELFTSRYGCQIYKFPVPAELVGKTYREVLNQLKDESDFLVIGIEENDQGQKITMTNPPSNRITKEGEVLITISEKPPESQ